MSDAQSFATITAMRRTVGIMREQIEFLTGVRRKSWDGDYVRRLSTAAFLARPGCLTCSGLGTLNPETIACEPCPDCDPKAPGFAP